MTLFQVPSSTRPCAALEVAAAADREQGIARPRARNLGAHEIVGRILAEFWVVNAA
jgi:hypothetical protein